MSQELLVLIDASSYFYRAFHALPPLTNSKGQPTGAVYGVVNMIRRLISDYQPDKLGVILDPKGKTFRDDLYAEYKANRPPMPDDLRIQFEPMVAVLKALGYPLVVVDGYEADDVIGTLAVAAEKAGKRVVISTGDKDMAQLVNANVTLINTMSNTAMDRDKVIEKFGVPPELIIDYLALVGDKVDNVPGVNKCGPKTAVKWLTAYKDLAGVMTHADEVSGKVGEYLREALDALPLSKTLVTIKTDVPLEITLDDLTANSPDKLALQDLYQDLEFKNWLKGLLVHNNDNSKPEASAPLATAVGTYTSILTEADFESLLDKLKSASTICIDTETTSLDAMLAKLVGVSLAFEENTAYYIPVAHDYEGAPVQLPRDYVIKKLQPLLSDPSKNIIAQNAKYDMKVLQKYGVNLDAKLFDTMLESYVLNSGANRHDMDTLALKYLGKNTIRFEDVAGKGKSQLTFNQVPLEDATPYAAEDADITLQLHQVLFPQIIALSGVNTVFNTIEMPLVPLLAHMERVGVLIDSNLLTKQSAELAITIADLEKEAHALAGEEFNLASPKQLGEVLYEKLKLPVLKKTPKGAPSTAEAVLSELALDYPLPNLILQYRSLSKLKSTYTDTLPLQVNPETGRIHTSYNQAVAATGRLSSTEPNLQNIPVRTVEGRRIRQAFVAPAGYKIVSADYSQIELRIMAHLSNDEALLNAFSNGWDVHQATAAEVFGIELEEVSADQRRHAKAINFGLIYGMSAFGLSQQIDNTREVAQAYIELYFERYPGVKAYMERTRKKAHADGFVETIFGRRLYLPEINAQNKMRQKAAERAAINAPLQGSAADIIKRAMINVDQWLYSDRCGLDAKMIMQVHDELVFEVAEKDVEPLVAEIENIMCHAVELAVPMTMSIGVGNNWDEAH